MKQNVLFPKKFQIVEIYLDYMYEWPMGKDNGVGINCGSGGWAEQRRAKGENWDNCNRITIKKTKLQRVAGCTKESHIPTLYVKFFTSERIKKDFLILSVFHWESTFLPCVCETNH